MIPSTIIMRLVVIISKSVLFLMFVGNNTDENMQRKCDLHLGIVVSSCFGLTVLIATAVGIVVHILTVVKCKRKEKNDANAHNPVYDYISNDEISTQQNSSYIQRNVI